LIVIISLPHLYPSSPRGRGRRRRKPRLHPLRSSPVSSPSQREGGGVRRGFPKILPLPEGGGGLRRGRVYFLFRYRIDWIVDQIY